MVSLHAAFLVVALVVFEAAAFHVGRAESAIASPSQLIGNASLSDIFSPRRNQETGHRARSTVQAATHVISQPQFTDVLNVQVLPSSLVPHLPSFGACPPGVLLSRSPALPVDLILKTRSADADTAAYLFASLRLFWADYSTLTLVLDTATEAAAVTAYAPPRSRWIVEPLRHPKAVGYAGMMWSNLWADTYTAAPLLGILDSDAVLQLRTDRASLLTDSGELVMRYLRCERVSSPSAAASPAWRAFEAADGCLFRRGVVHLLKAPYVGNFMVQTPFVVPRAALAALREHVERVHRRPFDDVMAEATGLQGDRSFSQQSAVGNFLLHFGNSSGVLAALDGGAAAAGVTGIRFVAWGRDEMAPHVGRHLGWEGGDARRKAKRRGGAGYARAAAGIIRRGVCRSYADADPEQCAAERLPHGAATLADELFWFENVRPQRPRLRGGAGTVPGDVGLRYAAGVVQSCHGPSRA